MISVAKEDLRLMLFSTFRYSLGRQTYMPSEAQRYVKEHHMQALSIRDLEQLAEEIDEHVRVYGGDHGLGSEFDAKGWRSFQEWCRRTAKERGVPRSGEEP